MSTEIEIERFWNKVNKSEACWVWHGWTSDDGYGLMMWGGRKTGAHRISWEINTGPIPRGIQVLHRCDNPPCVNPAHLFLGTQTDNVRDMDEKARRNPAFGERHGRAKLTEDKVREIRRAYAVGDTTYTALAKQYGVAFSMIARIVKGEGWSHVQEVTPCQQQ